MLIGETLFRTDTAYRLATYIGLTGGGDISSGVSPLSSVCTVLGGKKRVPRLVLLRRDGGCGGPRSFHQRAVIAIFVVGRLVASSIELVLKLYNLTILSEDHFASLLQAHLL
jgi:hypothetical protein